MRIFAGPALAAAVTRAGGIGFMGPGAKPTDLDAILSEAKTLLGTSVPSKNSLLPIGIGFQTFSADLALASQAIQITNHARCGCLLRATGRKSWTSGAERSAMCLPGPRSGSKLALYAMRSRRRARLPPRTYLCSKESMPEDMDWRKVQGSSPLLPEVADELGESNIPLMAAGGIADGRGVAAALSLGAAGAVMGTRFLAAKEANLSKGYQGDVLRVKDGGQNTVRTTLYDELSGRTDWPPEYDGRNVVNQSILDHSEGVEFEQNKKLYQEATKKGDDGWGAGGRLTAYVGSAVGLIREVIGAEDIVKRARADAIASLERAKSAL